MKKLQKLVALVVCLVTALVGIISVNAASYPTKITGIKKGAVLKYNGYDSLFYKTNSSYKMFCTKFHVADVGSSCSLASSQWSKPVQAGVAGIVKKYNGSKSQKNYYYSELAINEFLYYYGGKNSKNRISTTRDVRNSAGVKSFYTAGVEAYKKAKADFKFKFTNSKLTFSESGNYYVSNKLTVKDANNNLSSYTVSASGAKGAEIYKKSGNSFYVRVPKSSVKVGGSVTIKVTAKGTKTYAVSKNFNCGSNRQTLTPNTTTNESTKKTINLSGKITKKGNKVVIYKRIAGTNTNLAGAKLKLVSSDAKFNQTWTTTTSGKEFKNLTAGTYTLSEVSAPEGYTKTDKTVTFKVAYNDKTQNFVVENKKIAKTTVKALKIDAETNKGLAGAVLVVKDSKGKEIDKWTTTTDAHTIKNIKEKGKYTLSEISAPEGYTKTDKVQTFEVKEDGKTVTLKVENTAQKLTKVKALKIDEDTKQGLAGAVLVVKDSKGKEIDKWTTTTDAHEVSNIKEKGTYTLSEVSAPEGYTKTDKVQTFEVKKNNETISLEVSNKKIVTKVQIIKIDSETKKPLAGATLVVKDKNGKVRHSFVSSTSAETIEGLEKGTYTLSETIAPKGYELTDEVKTFEVKYDGKVVEVEMENKPITIVTGAKISKQDVTNGKELPGAHLVVKDANGEVVKEWVSTDTPYEFELAPGKYTLSETIAPEGYQLKTETVEFEVFENGEFTSVVMYNSPENVPDIPDVPTEEEKYPVKISKQDITTKQELPGATLIIKDSDGKEIYRWVSSNTPKEIELPAGDYTLTEIQAPSGYDLSYEVVEFTVKADKSVTTEAVMYNSKTPQTADRNIILLVFTLISTGIGSVFGFKKFRKQL